jgi:hypothetical protein
MAYCRCQNTLEALVEVADADIDPKKLGREEMIAFNRLMKLCKGMAERYPEEAELS